MRKYLSMIILIISSVLYGCVSAGGTLASGKGSLKYEKTGNGVKVASASAEMSVEVWKGDILKVIWRKKGAQVPQETIVTAPEPPPFEVSEGDNIISLRTDRLTAEINMESGAVTYYDMHKNLLLAEGGRFVEETPEASGKYSVKQEFMFRPWEGLYGLEGYSSPDIYGAPEFNIKNSGKFPLLVSTAGYGIIWQGDNGAKFSGKPDDSYFSSDNAGGLEYYFIYGGTAGKTIAAACLITGKPSEPGNDDIARAAAMATGGIENNSKLGNRFLPYVSSSLWETFETGMPFIQQAAAVYTEGLKPHFAQYQYMAGKFIMACPVTMTAGTAAAELPEGRVWYDFWKGIAMDGGQSIKLKVEKGKTPIYIPAGSILPLSASNNSLEIRVYPGQDAEFTMHYGTAGNSNIRLYWEQRAKTLTIGQLKGGDVAGVKGMKMKIVFVKKGHGAGAKEEPKPDSVVDYNGEITFVRMK